MNIREYELGSRIAQRLDQGLVEIDQAALTRLRSARGAALERIQVQPAWEPTPASGPSFRSDLFRFLNPRYMLPLAALLAAIYGMMHWQYSQHIDDVVDIDAKLLSGDLPIDAYLDSSLDSWLKR